MLTGENGIINNAKKAGEETKREEAREKISVILAGAQIDKQTKKEYNQDEYLDNYVKQYLPNIEIAEDEIGLNGYVFELDRSVPKLGNYIGEAGNLPPRIGRITVIEKTESTINVEVSAIRADGLKYRYSYKDHESTEYIQVSEIENNQYKFTGLTMIICDIKVELVDGNKVVDTEEISVLLVDVNEDGVLKFGEVTWAEGKASVQVSTNTKYKIEYQLNNTTGTWSQLTGTQITNIPNGTTVYARLSTGTIHSESISIKILDMDLPQKANIILSSTVTRKNRAVDATIEHIDNESGVNISKCRWVYNTISTPIGIEEKLYTGGNFNKNLESIKLICEEINEYYIHILTTDNQGNKYETISQPIYVKDEPKIVGELLEGEYIKYTVSDGNKHNFIILYGSENENYNKYGIQAIAENTIGEIRFAQSKPIDEAIIVYNEAITKLNSIADSYNNNKFSTFGRSVGSVPDNRKQEPSSYYYTNFISKYSGKLKRADENYKEDYEQMLKLNILKVNSNGYWLASRNIIERNNEAVFSIRAISYDNLRGDDSICGLKSNDNGTYITWGNYRSVRPVFQMIENVKITGGNGTKESPYELGI